MRLESKIHFFFISIRKFIINNRKKINRAFAGLLTILALFSALPLFSDEWRPVFMSYCKGVATGLPPFISHFYDPRSFILYIIGLYIWMRSVYYKHESKFLELALINKRDLAEELPKIKQACPSNHYLGLIIGRLNEMAMEIKDRRGAEIITTIDKNIKKYERVYWVSEEHIGIIFYEISTKDESDFINYVIKNKLKNEIGPEEAALFLDNIDFAMVKIEKHEELYDIESKARAKLIFLEKTELME